MMRLQTGPRHPSLLPVDGGINFRDQGGYAGADGRKVKYKLLFRSGSLSHLTEQDCHYLDTLPLVHILDYRDPDEIASKPDIIWHSANYENIPANPFDESVSASLNKIEGHNIRSYYPDDYMLKLYQQLPFNNPAYHRLVALLRQPDNNALVQHCAVGKDRTGVGAAIVLFALGADYHTVMQDYLLTEQTLKDFRDNLLNTLATKVDERALVSYQNMLAAKQEFLDTAINEINLRYKSVDNWLQHEYGLTAEVKQQIQDKYLQA